MSQGNDVQGDEVRWLFQLDRVLGAVSSICLYMGMALIVAIAILTAVHVIGRYAFGAPIKGQAELAIYMLITAVFLAITSTQLVKGHTTIGLIVDRLSKRTQAIIDSVTYFLGLVTTVLVFWQCIVQANHILQSGRVSTILKLPQFPVYYIMAVCWVLISLVILMQLVRLIHTAVKQ